jgi:hypothetical protein
MTLVELLIVIGIIAVLAGLLFPVFTSVRVREHALLIALIILSKLVLHCTCMPKTMMALFLLIPIMFIF